MKMKNLLPKLLSRSALRQDPGYPEHEISATNFAQQLWNPNSEPNQTQTQERVLKLSLTGGFDSISPTLTPGTGRIVLNLGYASDFK
jgi:hypothetical protein